MVGRTVRAYHVQSLLGRGGMGEVYRARDVRLGRDVALKILPRDVSDDPERLARFEREARLLAALNHPNIATIYGVEEDEGVRAIVMELVEGETLAERLTSSSRPGAVIPLTLTTALDIARQLADALDAAHERGIIHRDLKPANIKITPDGVVKVLDFGIAKVAARDEQEFEGTTRHATHHGAVIGTAAYMSPEQARGHAVDKRADIWAFGCVLYEMLSGRPAYEGASRSDTIAAVLTRQPDWDALPSSTPQSLRRLLERCLETDLKQRQRDIGDARRELEPALDSAARPPASRLPRVRWLMSIGFALTAGVAAVLGWWTAGIRREEQTPRSTVTRVTWHAGLSVEPALSPDGNLVVYASDGGGGGDLDLWLQRLGGGTPIQLTNNDVDDREPAFSPDGLTIAFRSERAGGGVYVMPALGGDARLIAPQGRRPRFSPDGSRITCWTGTWLGGSRTLGSAIFVVPANGGTPQRIATDFVSARNPIWSPDGQRVLFFGRRDAGENAATSTTLEADASPDDQFDWWIVQATGGAATATGVYRLLLAEGISFYPGWSLESQPETWDPDGVVFSATIGQATNLWRVRLSADGSIDGAPMPLTTGAGADTHPSADSSGRIAFQVSESTLGIYKLALAADEAKSLDRITRLAAHWGFRAQRGSVSADGVTVAFPKHRANSSELWVRNSVTGGERHLVSTGDAGELNPTISPDGGQVGYTLNEKGRRIGYVVSSSGGTARVVCEACTLHGWLTDGRILAVFSAGTPRVRVIDTATLSSTGVFDTAGQLNRVFATSDDRSVAVGERDGAWIVPLDAGRVESAETALAIKFPKTDVTPGRIVGWSPNGRLLYSLLGLDGFRCLYAQHVDLDKHIVGEPFVVHHFHAPDRVWGSSPFSNAIVNGGFVFDQMETAASIWLMTPR